MTINDSGFSIEKFTLAHEDPAEGRQIFQEWLTAYPCTNPIERGFVRQAMVAQLEKRRVERIRATLRAERVRTAVLEWEHAREDQVADWLERFNEHPPSALVGLLRSAAGCRWAIAYWESLQKTLADEGTWTGANMVGAIQLQGRAAGVPDLYYSEPAFTTYMDCLACQTKPKQRDIDRALDRSVVPKGFQDREVTLWPRDPAECRARLQALVDRELPRLRALEATLRVQYEEPARAAAEDMALAQVTPEETALLHAERIHEQSYAQAITSLLKVRKQAAVARAVVVEWETEEEAGSVEQGAWRVGRNQETQAVRPTSSGLRPDSYSSS